MSRADFTTHVHFHSLITRLRSGSLTVLDYIEETCARIDDAEPDIQALLPEEDRHGRLRREAEALRDRYPEPEGRPPLYGVLVGVKDIFNVDGFETRAGSKLPPELFAGPEAPVVTRLKELGALILGKTVTTEFACFVPGPTRNPVNTAYTPGGSSSGSAAAVAAGYCPLALGSQTIGSVIRPAAFCGIAGFKPSRGLLSTEGVVPVAPSLDHVGFFTQDAEELAVPLSMLTGEPEEEGPGWATLAIPEGPYLAQTSPEALAAFEAQVARLERGERRIKRVCVLEDIESINQAHKRLMMAEMAIAHDDWFARYEGLYAPETAALIREGRTVPESEIASARNRRDGVERELSRPLTPHRHSRRRFTITEWMEALKMDGGIWAWIAPAATDAPPAGIASTGDPIMNLPWTLAGMPVATVYADKAESGMPFGMQIVGEIGNDAFIAALANQLSKELRYEYAD